MTSSHLSRFSKGDVMKFVSTSTSSPSRQRRLNEYFAEKRFERWSIYWTTVTDQYSNVPVFDFGWRQKCFHHDKGAQLLSLQALNFVCTKFMLVCSPKLQWKLKISSCPRQWFDGYIVGIFFARFTQIKIQYGWAANPLWETFVQF